MKKLNDILEAWETSKEPSHNDMVKTRKKYEEIIKNYPEEGENNAGIKNAYSLSSRDLNSYHWDNHQGKKYDDKYTKEEHYKENTESMDKAIYADRAPHPIQVYSGTRHDPREIKNEKGIVHHPAYLSVSHSRDIAENFAKRNSYIDKSTEEDKEKYGPNIRVYHRHLLKFTIPKGHPAAVINRGEQEFVLPRGTNLKHVKTDIQSHTEEKYGLKHFYHNHIHHMKIVK